MAIEWIDGRSKRKIVAVLSIATTDRVIEEKPAIFDRNDSSGIASAVIRLREYLPESFSFERTNTTLGEVRNKGIWSLASNLEGEKLIRWRSKQLKKYSEAGLSVVEAQELLTFVETPNELIPGSHERFNFLAGKALDGGV